ncbi:transportin MOS14 [Impatiens glandulifera]|uniref:transportin MOS14 n=1 Tax=Impatiens glandulifera TaxID=253017 RepID=UPI001FB1352C|nr:transportin MOS14 [Impatiens glandulifera]
MELQNAVKQALNALYHHPDDAVHIEADRWLQEFQRTLDAWQVADNLLHDVSSNQETLIFCSQTLRSKVQRDFEELPPEAFCPLRDSLTTLLKTFHTGPPKVRTQISLAVAALAVHVSTKDWGDGGIVNWLRDQMKSHPECIPSFLELLKVLPEEVFNYKIAVRPDRRRQFEKELTFAVEAALDILTACGKFVELKEQVLEAFASWLRLRPRIPTAVLVSHPLVLTALSSLNSDILSEASVNVISELIHYTSSKRSSCISEQMPLIQVIVPQVMNLKEQLKDPSKDEEDVKAIARLFADMGDSYVELIANGSDESMLIVYALLEVASHQEYDIACMTFNFWHNLQTILIERHSYTSFGDESSIEAERNRRILIFQSSYESLVSLVSSRVQYPEDYGVLTTEDQKDFKQTRYDVADVLIDAAVVLGGEATLKILYMKFGEAVARSQNEESSRWQPAEAALYCIRAISDYVSFTEAEFLPQIMSLLPTLPRQHQLLTTVCLTIGAYSKWINASPGGFTTFLPSLIEILVSGMSVSEDSAAAAALAFRHICNDCGKRLSGSLDGLFHIYQRAVTGEGSFKVSAEDSLHLVEALSVVITELPPEHAKRALEMLCLPAANSLQEIINQGPLILGQVNARDVTVHIDRLANIFRYASHPEAVADTIQRIWPIFKAIFDTRAWDTRTMESLCRACKNAVRTSRRFMGVTIGAMLEEIQGLYTQHHQPCFLYLSSEVIKIFGSDQSCADYLKILIESLFSQTTHLLTKIEEFTSRPDIADDCFLLASRCIRYCPQLFFPSPIFPSLVDCSMVGITVQHREASNSILTFLSDICDLSNSGHGEQYLSIRDGVMVPRGACITRILLASLTGALPPSRIESVIYTLVALTRAYKSSALEWAKIAVSLIPLSAVKEVERSSFIQALSDLASGANINALTIPIEELAEVCRRNRTVQEIVQGALKPLEIRS